MDVFYEDTYQVNTGDVDLFGHCRPYFGSYRRQLSKAGLPWGSRGMK